MGKLIFIFKDLFFSLSICRILQIWELKKLKLSGSLIEFGAYTNQVKNFSYHLNKNNLSLYFSNIDNKNKKFLNINLEKKNKIKKRFNNILIFNVLEHLINLQFSILQLKKILKKNGLVVGSTPFLYRVHGAPKDCFRFTSYILKKELSKNFHNVKVFDLGYGPFTACFSIISDYTKIIPLLNILLIIFSISLDKILNLFIKTDLKTIYPIAIFFIAKKIK